MTTIVLSSCNACALFAENGFNAPEEKIMNGVMKRICKGISEKNTDAIKAEFRYEDISKLEDFDTSVNKLIDYVKGDNLKYRSLTAGRVVSKTMGYATENCKHFGIHL